MFEKAVSAGAKNTAGTLDKILSKLDNLDSLELTIESVISMVDEGIKAQEFNVKQLEDKLVKHVEECGKKDEAINKMAEDT